MVDAECLLKSILQSLEECQTISSSYLTEKFIDDKK